MAYKSPTHLNIGKLEWQVREEIEVVLRRYSASPCLQNLQNFVQKYTFYVYIYPFNFLSPFPFSSQSILGQSLKYFIQ
jgi:hypothetical protein